MSMSMNYVRTEPDIHLVMQMDKFSLTAVSGHMARIRGLVVPDKVSS